MTTPAELRTLRQQAYDLAGLVQFAHEAQQAGLDPADTDPVEFALRVARYRRWPPPRRRTDHIHPDGSDPAHPGTGGRHAAGIDAGGRRPS
jgi:hypothetical protein